MRTDYYCVRESYGIGTNLQLYALQQARKYWNDLNAEKKWLHENQIRERCVVLIALLGLSVSQLLGQNTSFDNSEDWVPGPKNLLNGFLNGTSLDSEYRENLIQRFDEFNGIYESCRHFGSPKRSAINAIDCDTTEIYLKLAYEIWDLVLAHFRREREREIEYTAVEDILSDMDIPGTEIRQWD